METTSVRRSSGEASASPDPSWRGLYRVGGVSAALYVVLIIIPLVLLNTTPSPGGVSGHAWLRVRIGDEELNVCSGSNNQPGVTQFEILSKVRTWQPWLRPFTHLGSSIENIRRDMMARRGLKGASAQPA